MITRKTVLVLGAGASAPYGFPTGRALLLNICRDLENASPLRQTLLALDYSEDVLDKFRYALKHSMQPSVDAFLERRTEFMPVGKAAIAAALIPFEMEEHLSRGESERWYEYLWQKLTTRRLEEFERNCLTIVTFNYDRSLEQFLYRALQNSYALEDDKIAKLLRRVPVIHLYGKLGGLPRLGEGGRGYSPDVRPDDLEQWAGAIRIFNEKVPPGDPNFQAAWIALSEAEEICFLGFGYHEVNVERLRVRETFKHGPLRGSRPNVYGSAFGVEEGERPAIKRLFPHDITLGDPSVDVLGMLRNYPILG